LAGVSPFFHVPEEFLRRFQDTRDANNSVFLAGTIVFLLLFLFLAGGGGMIHLIRHRLVEWKAPLAWGVVVAGLLALGTINSLPLAWMEYDTALPSQVFVGTIIVVAGLSFVTGAIFLALLFMTGEGLMRLGFPDEIQLWKMWSPGVANSTSVLGRTAAPYLVLGVELGFVVTFYLITARLAGWWSPASSLVEPDFLASYLPWLTAVSTSLFAALSEETIFRAIPIGAAAVLGRKYGRPGLWIWSAIVLQAVVFGASHANYPQQPAFARVVEIFPVYLGWGLVCAYFGLVPAIIGHYTYDLVLFSLPLFTAETQGIWVDRAIVVAAGLLPLFVVVVARWRRGSVPRAPEWALNRTWTAPAPSESEEPAASDPDLSERALPVREEGQDFEVPGGKPAGLSKRTWTGVVVLGLTGLLLGVTADPPTNPPTFTINRSQAERAARSALEEVGVTLGEEWTPLFSVAASQGTSHQFVWREGSPDDYRTLIGGFLSSPRWIVRFVRFGAEPEERAESYSVTVGPSGQVLGIAHRLPEARPGASLTEEAGRSLAEEALRGRLNLDPGTVREISAEETVQPNRTDWTFTFSAPGDYPLSTGEGRAEVRIAGDEVTNAYRFVHIPEDWERSWRADESRRQLAFMPLMALLLLLVLAGGIVAIVGWARGSLQTAQARVLTLILLFLLLASAVNGWPGTMGGFNAEESYLNQMGIALVALVLGQALIAGSAGILGGLGHTWINPKRRALRGAEWAGLALGMAYAGGMAALAETVSQSPPAWPGYGAVLAFLPWLSIPMGIVTDLLIAIAGALLVVATLDHIREHGRIWMLPPLLLLLGLTGASNTPGTPWILWICSGLGIATAVALLWVVCRRWGWAILPGVIAASAILQLLELLTLQPHLGWSSGGFLGLIGILIVVRVWTMALQGPRESKPT
jgi:membrane protease YdiL (CAAX protease family)